MSLTNCLDDLKALDAALSNSLLNELSDLSPEEAAEFLSVWRPLPAERKARALDRLIELTQERTELDFSAVFRPCLRDSSPQVRRRGIEGLWEHEERRLVAPLCELLANDPSSSVRAAAAVGLGKFAELCQMGKMLPKDHERVEQCLISTLENEDEELDVRRRALESAAVFNTAAMDAYIRWAYASDDPSLQSSALYAMGRTGEDQWLSSLIKETRNPSPPLRYEAATACGQLEEPGAVPHLALLLRDDDLQVQLAAVRAMGAIGGPAAKRALRLAVKEGDAAVEDAARECLETVDALDDATLFTGSP